MNSTKLLFIALLFFAACKSGTEKEKSQNQEPELKDVTPEAIFQDASLDGQPMTFYLNHQNVDEVVVKYYYQEYLPDSEKKMKKLLSALTSKKGALLPFYYKCFNWEYKKEHDDFQGIMGEFALKMLTENTDYIIDKLKDGDNDYFTGYISYAFYQNESWKDDINKLKEDLFLNLTSKDPKHVREVTKLIEGIENDVVHLQEEEA